eukprot:15446875-Alexandrium_andersonii.AAC.1
MISVLSERPCGVLVGVEIAGESSCFRVAIPLGDAGTFESEWWRSVAGQQRWYVHGWRVRALL